MPERTWIDLAALVIGGVVAWLVLRVGKDRGIGPQIRMTLALALICPVVLILGLEKVLSGETIAAIVGALVGSGVPTSGATPPSASR